MKKLTQILTENKDTILEGLIHSVKEEVCQRKDTFYEDEADALLYISYSYEDVEIFYEETWRRLKDVRLDFSEEKLLLLRRALFKMLISTIKLIARIDKSIESKNYWDYVRKETE